MEMGLAFCIEARYIFMEQNLEEDNTERNGIYMTLCIVRNRRRKK